MTSWCRSSSTLLAVMLRLMWKKVRSGATGSYGSRCRSSRGCFSTEIQKNIALEQELRHQSPSGFQRWWFNYTQWKRPVNCEKRRPDLYQDDISDICSADILSLPDGKTNGWGWRQRITSEWGEFIEQAQVYLLIDLVYKETPARSMPWYDGGRSMSEERAQRYGIAPQMSSTDIAVLSP